MSIANLGLRFVVPPDVERTEFGSEVYPEALHQLIMRIWKDYRRPIYITENGCSYGDGPDESGAVNDDRRVRFLQGYIGQVGRAIRDGADVLESLARGRGKRHGQTPAGRSRARLVFLALVARRAGASVLLFATGSA